MTTNPMNPNQSVAGEDSTQLNRISDEELDLFRDWKLGQPITIDMNSIGSLIQEVRAARTSIRKLTHALLLQATRQENGPCFCVIPDGHQFLSHEPWCKEARSALGPIPEERAGMEATEGEADRIVTSLYRKFKDWSKRGFGPEDVTWCEVKAEIVELLAAQPSVQKDEYGKPCERCKATGRIPDTDWDERYRTMPAVRCVCGEHEIPKAIDGINWYWQHHSRTGCTLELPDIVCWCGLKRSQHKQDGHKPSAVFVDKPSITDERGSK